MKSLWASGGISNLVSIHTNAFRMVEDQARSSTRKLVDTLEEHEILEQLLEETKPTQNLIGDEVSFIGLHYLLFTPFRYPPLKTGSRFGSLLERNLFYASLDLETTLYEKAFHRFRFLLASEAELGGRHILCTAFEIKIKTKKGIDLTKMPFAEYRPQISSPFSYQDSQMLGTCMRESGIEAFISHSARNPLGKNINIYTPSVFDKKQDIEKTFRNFQCYSTKKLIEFQSYPISNHRYVFKVEDFLVDEQFPLI